MTMRTVTGLFDTYDDAAQTVRAFEAAGIAERDISLVVNNVDGSYRLHGKERDSNAGSGAGTGAGIGTVIGGGAGLLAGLGMLAIPGVGPVVAAGWLAATAAGAVAGAAAGAATGGLIGALTSDGVDEDHAQIYAEGVRRGGVLVTARVDERRVAEVEALIERHGPVDIDARGRAYRESGWREFDETADPYSPSEMARERNLNRPNMPV